MSTYMRKNLFRSYYVILAFLFFARLLPFLMPEARLWGINQLLFLPTDYTIAYLALFIIALMLPFIIKPQAISGITDWFSNAFYDSDKKYYYSLGLIIPASRPGHRSRDRGCGKPLKTSFSQGS